MTIQDARNQLQAYLKLAEVLAGADAALADVENIEENIEKAANRLAVIENKTLDAVVALEQKHEELEQIEGIIEDAKNRAENARLEARQEILAINKEKNNDISATHEQYKADLGALNEEHGQKITAMLKAEAELDATIQSKTAQLVEIEARLEEIRGRL